MVMYDNAFETTDKISEDNIEPHHTYSISYGDTERAKCPVKRVEFRENERAFFNSPGTNQTVRNNEVSVLSGRPKSGV